MITCVATEDIPKNTFCALEPGTLRLREVSGEEATFITLRDIRNGEAISVVPLDMQRLFLHGFGIPVT